MGETGIESHPNSPTANEQIKFALLARYSSALDLLQAIQYKTMAKFPCELPKKRFIACVLTLYVDLKPQLTKAEWEKDYPNLEAMLNEGTPVNYEEAKKAFLSLRAQIAKKTNI